LLPCIQIPLAVQLIITALATLLTFCCTFDNHCSYNIVVACYTVVTTSRVLRTTLLLETNKTWTMDWTLDSIMDLIIGLTGILIPCIRYLVLSHCYVGILPHLDTDDHCFMFSDLHLSTYEAMRVAYYCIKIRCLG